MAVAQTTVAQLTTLMLSWLDDPNAGYFTAANTLTWLNFAQREVQKQLVMAGENYYVIPVETLTVYSQADYILPNDFLKENRLELILSGYNTVNEVRQPITPITLNEQDLVPNSLGTPVNYYIKKDRISLYPTPDTANLQLRLYYSPKISDLTLTTDVPDIPEEFMEYVAILAAENGFIKDDRAPDNLLTKKAMYEERLKQMADDRLQDTSRRVVRTEDYGYGGWF